MARLLDEGTAEHTPEEFAELLERKGIALGASVTDGGLGVDLDVPKRRLAEALDLLRQALAEPVFPEPEVERHRKTRLAQIEQERALAPQRAAQEFISTYFDGADRASRPTAGHHGEHLRPDPPARRRLPRRAGRPDGHDGRGRGRPLRPRCRRAGRGAPWARG